MTAIRDIKVANVDAVAGTETSYTIPVECNSLDIVMVNAQDDESDPPVDADGRLAFEQGETADGGAYIPLSTDYWTQDGLKFPAGKKLYLRSAIANEFKIVYGIGS